jgi:redox-sensitive bicupin YhaK (pirin superfamily)
VKIRRAKERGHAQHGWLESYHTFSFADYYDEKFMGFGDLRVINEDRVQPGRGFGTHAHRDMEIISYVLDGQLQHRDSLGTGSIIRPGEVQRMTAGTGITHSEFNPSRDELLHFLQIWIVPARAGLEPGYEQKAFPGKERQGALRLVASTDGRDGSVTVHQDVNVYATLLDDEEYVRYAIPHGRATWIHVAQGGAELNGTGLDAGDAAAFREDGTVDVVGREWADVLIFDLSQGGRS